MTSVPAAIELQAQGTRSHRSPSSIHQDEVSTPEDTPPTRTYQTLLVFSAFLMIFHIIGINTVFGIFQVPCDDSCTFWCGSPHNQDLYTSPESNIPSARGNDAVVSLVGTIGSGLTWSGGIFVNPIIARVESLKLITFIGAAVMSLGLFLASYSSTVRAQYICPHWS
jgi:tetrahydromethanopterin S-methyltransferase subunit D